MKPQSTAELARRTYVALLHHPVHDRSGRLVTTAVTNLDIHDIARASRTFCLAGYFVVTPIEAQRALVQQIVGHWTDGSGREHNAKRTDALEMVRIVESLEDVVAALGDPYILATGARLRTDIQVIPPAGVAKEVGSRPLLLVFGTGWGLADSVFTRAHAMLPSLKGPDPSDGYNHLSVRSAVAIVLDRLFGNRD